MFVDWTRYVEESIEIEGEVIQFKDNEETTAGIFAAVKFSVSGESNARQFRLGKKDGKFASHLSVCDGFVIINGRSLILKLL